MPRRIASNRSPISMAPGAAAKMAARIAAGSSLRGLSAVAIAAGAQNNDQLSGSVRTQSIERLSQGVRLMRVINKNLRATAFANAFEPSFGAIEVLKRCEYR